MMRASALCFALLLPELAQAQAREAFVQRQRETIVADEATARKVSAAFGTCVVKWHPTAAASFVLYTGDDDKVETALRRKVLDSDCIGERELDGADEAALKFPGDTIRYVIADALVRRELTNPPQAGFADIPPLEAEAEKPSSQNEPDKRVSKRRAEEIRRAKAESLLAHFMGLFGECVVRSNPAGSHALLMTDILGSEETAEIRKLMPVLASCVPGQQQLALNKTAIRGAIALNYYRLATARAAKPAAAPAGGAQ